MLGIGILGAAGIAPQALIRPARRRDDVKVLAVASRRANAADAYAAEHGIAVAHHRYEDLLADPAVDVVYNALPPSLHAEWSIRAVRAGKHVLCEKPAALDPQQAQAMTEAAAQAGRVLIEAFHDHYHPVLQHAVAAAREGQIGQVRRLEGTFTAPIPFDPSSIRHDPAVGGGALLDLGCYPVHWLRAVAGTEPIVTAASASPNELGADQQIEAELAFADDLTGRIFASMGQAFASSLVITGSGGRIEIENPVLPHRGHSVRTVLDGVEHTSTIGGRETYDYQLDAVVAAIQDGQTPATSGQDIVANAALIDAIYRQAGWRG
ncbi:MAG: Gfo/Idh/MocA family protein [Beutenbergiaceae bacterium]